MKRIPIQHTDMEFVDIPGTSIRASRIALGTWAIGGWMWGGSDERDADRHYSRRARSRHQPDRHGAGLWLRAFRRNRRQGAGRGRPPQARADRHQGRARLEGRQAVSQRQQGPDRQGSRGFPAPAEDRRHRSLSGALAGSQYADRGNRRSHGRAASRRQNPRHRRQQFQPGPDEGIPQASRRCTPRNRLTTCSNARSRRDVLPYCRRTNIARAGLWRALPRTAVRQHVDDRPTSPATICARPIQNSSSRASSNIWPRCERLDRFAQERLRQARDPSRGALGARSRRSNIALVGRAARRSACADRRRRWAGISTPPRWRRSTASCARRSAIPVGPEFMAPPARLAA